MIGRVAAMSPRTAPVAGRATVPAIGVAIRAVVAPRIRSSPVPVARTIRSTIAAGAASVGCCSRLCQHQGRSDSPCCQRAQCKNGLVHIHLLSSVIRVLPHPVYVRSRLDLDAREIGPCGELNKYDFAMPVSEIEIGRVVATGRQAIGDSDSRIARRYLCLSARRCCSPKLPKRQRIQLKGA
jgi:hypothetical protein